MEAQAERLAAYLAAREVRVGRDPRHAGWGEALIVRRDPLDGVTVPWPLENAEGPLSLWEPIALGVDELGRTMSVRLPERNLCRCPSNNAGR